MARGKKRKGILLAVCELNKMDQVKQLGAHVRHNARPERRRFLVPEGQPDNSPTIHRWVTDSRVAPVPKGRLNMSYVLREFVFPLRFQHQGMPASDPQTVAGKTLALPRRHRPDGLIKAIEIAGVPKSAYFTLPFEAPVSIAKVSLHLIKGTAFDPNGCTIPFRKTGALDGR